MLTLSLGALLLFVGAESLVRGSASLAARFGVSPLIAGLTVVAFGTSAPELSVSVSSALAGKPDLALGNVVGSNIFNIAVILGLAAIIYPMTVHQNVIRRDIPLMIGFTGIALGLIVVGHFSRLAGLGLVVALGLYLWYTIYQARRETRVSSEPPLEGAPTASKHWALDVVMVIGGLAALVIGSNLFVEGATRLATRFGVSDAVIGVTIVAAGTSLPELATSVVAAWRRQSDIAVGNIVGSNIFNLLCILGITATVSPFEVSDITSRDGMAMLACSLILLPFAVTDFRISRWEGAVLLLLYGIYLYLVWPAG